MKILLVDDHPLFRDGLKRIFTALPEVDEVLEAGDGIECLAMLEKHHIDAVMLDIRMPNMDGIECLRRIRMKWETLKVMVVTQFGEKRCIRSMIRLGANGYLLKTTSEQNLVETFRQMMNDDYSVANNLPDGINNEDLFPSTFIDVPDNGHAMMHRMVQEMMDHSLNNSAAKEITLKISVADTHMRLSYADTGHGFNPEDGDIAQSLGMQSKATSLRLKNGLHEISSTPGHGTQVTIDFQIPTAHEDSVS